MYKNALMVHTWALHRKWNFASSLEVWLEADPPLPRSLPLPLTPLSSLPKPRSGSVPHQNKDVASLYL